MRPASTLALPSFCSICLFCCLMYSRSSSVSTAAAMAPSSLPAAASATLALSWATSWSLSALSALAWISSRFSSSTVSPLCFSLTRRPFISFTSFSLSCSSLSSSLLFSSSLALRDVQASSRSCPFSLDSPKADLRSETTASASSSSDLRCSSSPASRFLSWLLSNSKSWPLSDFCFCLARSARRPSHSARSSATSEPPSAAAAALSASSSSTLSLSASAALASSSLSDRASAARASILDSNSSNLLCRTSASSSAVSLSERRSSAAASRASADSSASPSRWRRPSISDPKPSAASASALALRSSSSRAAVALSSSACALSRADLWSSLSLSASSSLPLRSSSTPAAAARSDSASATASSLWPTTSRSLPRIASISPKSSRSLSSVVNLISLTLFATSSEVTRERCSCLISSSLACRRPRSVSETSRTASSVWREEDSRAASTHVRTSAISRGTSVAPGPAASCSLVMVAAAVARPAAFAASAAADAAAEEMEPMPLLPEPSLSARTTASLAKAGLSSFSSRTSTARPFPPARLSFGAMEYAAAAMEAIPRPATGPKLLATGPLAFIRATVTGLLLSLLLRVSLLRFLCLSSAATAAATLDGRDPRRQNEARAALMDSLLVLDSSTEEPSGCRAPPRVGATKTSRWSFGLLATPRHPEWRAEPPPAGARRPAHLPVVEVNAIVVSGGLCPVPP
mmetsp:Transcript_8423/g.30384  ORF Transcript_8423/g.30384 Transcript_8423/m.30384 type:complete len:693 (-) Transcript_8423:50-2128(-)